MEFRILGPLDVRRDGRALPIRGRRRRALLALLLLRANRSVPFDVIVDELWGVDPPPTARAALQNQASALRRLLGPDRLLTNGPAYRLRVDPGELDLEKFEELVASARDVEPATRAERLSEALSLWRALPLVEFPSEPFAQDEVVRLEELRLSIVEERIDAQLANGRAEELVAELEQLVARHPLRERLWAFLMVALYRSGRQAEALATYRRAHDALVGELGIEPGSELKELQRRILLQDPAVGREGGGRDLLLDAVALFPTEDRERAHALLDYAQALRRLGENSRARAALAEAERMATAVGDAVLVERARLQRSEVEAFLEGASLRRHLQVAKRAVGVLRAAGDQTVLAQALRQQGQLLRDLGRASEAASAFEESVAAALAAGDRWQEGMRRNFLATALLFGPTPVPEAIAACERHLAALEWGPPGPIGLRVSLGKLVALDGRPDAGRRLITEAYEECRQAGVPSTFPTHQLASVELMVGDGIEAESRLREVCEILDAHGDRGGLCYARARLAYVVASWNPEEAERLARAVSRDAAEDDFSAQVGWRRALWRVEGTRQLLDEAEGLCSESDFLNLHASTLEDLAASCDAAGDRDGQRAALVRALDLYEAKGNLLASARLRPALA